MTLKLSKYVLVDNDNNVYWFIPSKTLSKLWCKLSYYLNKMEKVRCNEILYIFVVKKNLIKKNIKIQKLFKHFLSHMAPDLDMKNRATN